MNIFYEIKMLFILICRYLTLWKSTHVFLESDKDQTDFIIIIYLPLVILDVQKIPIYL